MVYVYISLSWFHTGGKLMAKTDSKLDFMSLLLLIRYKITSVAIYLIYQVLDYISHIIAIIMKLNLKLWHTK